MLLVLLEIVLLPEDGLDGVVLVGEIGLEAGAEVDVPPPDAAEHRFRILVVVRSELAVLAGILCHSRMLLSPDGTKVMLSYRITYDCLGKLDCLKEVLVCTKLCTYICTK